MVDKHTGKKIIGIILLLFSLAQLLRIFISKKYPSLIIKNTGIAFSLLKDKYSFITISNMLIISFLIYWLYKELQQPKIVNEVYALAIIIAGSLSNLYERLMYGYIVDYVQNPVIATFNFADAIITIALIFLIYKLFKE